MVQTANEDRAVQLAREAVELVDAGHREAASRNLREAIALAPDSYEVKSAFEKVREVEETQHQLLKLCQRFAEQKDAAAGEEAVRYLRTDGLRPSDEVAAECLKVVLAHDALSLPHSQEPIISELVRISVRVRRYLAAELQASVTKLFNEIYDRGDGAVVCLDAIVLDASLWPSEEVRLHCESELFQLFIAKLMESGHDHDGRSLKGIARLLAVDADKLQHLVDEEGFDVILSSLDNTLPIDVRSQATLAAAKYLEVSGEIGQKYFTDFITSRMAKQKAQDTIVAFSAAAAVFPILPSIMAALFLTEGFLQSLMPLLDRKIKGSRIQRAVLDLFNAACIDKACRESIAKYCSEWLSHVLTNGDDDVSDEAAVVLAKVRASESLNPQKSSGQVQEENSSVPELVDRFKQLMAKTQGANLRNPIEGLAYTSVNPEVKDVLAKDTAFLKDLFRGLGSNVSDLSLLYGGLMIILNLTKYLPKLTEEQKKMSQLKAYANTQKSTSAPNPLDEDEPVTDRCASVIEAGVMPMLIECGKTGQDSILNLTSMILVNLAKNTKVRGKLAQQGAVKLLVSILSTRANASKGMDETTQHASHALARILISVNPSHVFPSSGFPQITSAVRPLVALLSPPDSDIVSDQPRDLLPVFESLLALTNLASSPDATAAEFIIRLAWTTVEELLLASNTFVQRAACELVCNLMTVEAGVAKFADGSSRAGQRLHILLALADVDDVATRRAAGGALAMLTEYDAAAAAVLERPRGADILLRLCEEESTELVHRGVVCLQNLTHASGDIGARGIQALKDQNGIDRLRNCLKATSNPAVLQAGIEALKPLMQASG